MSKKTNFSTLAKNALGVTSNNAEFKTLNGSRISAFYDDYYKILKSFYSALFGRKQNEEIADIFLPLIMILPLNIFLGLKKLYSKTEDLLKDMLIEDSQLHSVQQFFPHFSEKLESLLKNNLNRPLFSIPFGMLIELSGNNDQDLIESTNVLGILIERLFIGKAVSTCYQLLEENNFSKCDIQSLKFIKEFTNTYTLVATQKSIPKITEENYKKVAKQLYSEAEKFGIKNDLYSLFDENKNHMLEVMEEILEIFKDFSDSSIRTKGLDKFEKQIKSLAT